VSAAQPDPYADPDRRHAAAVRRSLGWADEAAERADWADALGWIEVVEACGDELPDEFRAKRDRWLLALREQPPRGQRADPAA
jgi:hypothetical protein